MSILSLAGDWMKNNKSLVDQANIYLSADLGSIKLPKCVSEVTTLVLNYGPLNKLLVFAFGDPTPALPM